MTTHWKLSTTAGKLRPALDDGTPCRIGDFGVRLNDRNWSYSVEKLEIGGAANLCQVSRQSKI
jgi:hypothetical protein